MLITYHKIDRLQRRLDAACGVIQQALDEHRITTAVHQELHKQSLCYAGLIHDINTGTANAEDKHIQAMFECIESHCALIETELLPRTAA